MKYINTSPAHHICSMLHKPMVLCQILSDSPLVKYHDTFSFVKGAIQNYGCHCYFYTLLYLFHQSYLSLQSYHCWGKQSGSSVCQFSSLETLEKKSDDLHTSTNKSQLHQEVENACANKQILKTLLRFLKSKNHNFKT